MVSREASPARNEGLVVKWKLGSCWPDGDAMVAESHKPLPDFLITRRRPVLSWAGSELCWVGPVHVLP